MKTTTILQSEFWKPTGSWVSQPIETKVPSPSTVKDVGQIIYVKFDTEAAEELPAHSISLDDLLKEFESNPEMAESLSAGRKWVGENYYAGQKTLCSLRLAKGYSQVKLASILGTSQSHVARIESGREDLRLSTIQKLAHALEVSELAIIEAMKVQRPNE